MVDRCAVVSHSNYVKQIDNLFPGTVEKPKTHLDMPLEENINRRVLEEGEVEARSVEDAIAALR